MRPAEPIARALEAQAPPIVFASPTRRDVALLTRSTMASIAGRSPIVRSPNWDWPASTSIRAPMARAALPPTAGFRFARLQTAGGMTLCCRPGASVIAPLWSPDGRHLPFLIVHDAGIELWTAKAATDEARRMARHVNAAFPGPFAWLPDGSGLLVRLVPADRGSPPPMPHVPEGPVIRETNGRAPPSRRFPTCWTGRTTRCCSLIISRRSSRWSGQQRPAHADRQAGHRPSDERFSRRSLYSANAS